MLLYHGTNEEAAQNALKEGLKPRANTSLKGNWKHTVDSRDDCVYLSKVYAPYFAGCATENGRWAIIEIDTTRLDESLFLPDEDYMQQATVKAEIPDEPFYGGLRRANLAKDAKERLFKRNDWFRRNLHEYRAFWEQSIDRIGNCCYQGIIPGEAITRTSLFDTASNPTVMMNSMDPTISIMNYQFMKPQYEALTKWFMDDEFDPKDIFLFSKEIWTPEDWDRAIAELNKTEGREIIKAGGLQ